MLAPGQVSSSNKTQRNYKGLKITVCMYMHSCGQLQTTRYRKTKHPTATLRLLFSCEILSDSFCNPMDSSTPGSSVHGILQARTLEWPFPSPGDPPNPGIEPASPALAGRFLRVLWTMRSKQSILKEISPKYSLEGLMLKHL